ncbi:L-gulonolactone oxidase [Strigomonas culicis]|nr:L-gulonolactone oxidase [Strigomonas culicis]|eukprot:EPY23514.1 L-gulonolactone oxidase [Strigomonas culicis]
MTLFDKILHIDKKEKRITCEGGVLMRTLMEVLDREGLMLKCVPSYVETTVAGCLATATHSSGLDTHSLCDYVVALTLIDGTGQTREFHEDQDRQRLRTAACHLGVLGAVVQVTLQAEEKSVWHLHSRPVSIAHAVKHSLQLTNVQKHEYYRLWWVPHTRMCYHSFGKRVDLANPVIKGQYRAHEKQKKSIWYRLGAALRGDWLRHTVVQRCLWLTSFFPCLQPLVNKLYRRAFYSSAQTQFGSALECFTFDCLFKQWANEWAVDAASAPEVLRRLQDMIEKDNLHLHFPIEFRFSGADETLLSPAAGRQTCWVGVVMYRPLGREAPDTIRCYNRFCELMTAMGGRPHWAKYYQWGEKEMERAYGENWSAFLRLRAELDPKDIFVNEWFNNLLSLTPGNSTRSNMND